MPNKKWRLTQFKKIDGTIDSNFSDWSLTNALDETFARAFRVAEGKNSGLWYWCVNDSTSSKFVKENAGYSSSLAEAKAECEARLHLSKIKTA